MSACTNPIAVCPCAIKSAGDYTISGPGLIATPPGDCIHANVSGVTLDLGSATLSTSPASATSVGVLVTANAAGAVVKGTLGAPATVTGFGTGIEVDAPGVTLQNLVAQTNGVGIQMQGGAGYCSALAANNSSRTGILINGPAAGPYLNGIVVDGTLGFAGIELSGVHGAFLTNLTVTGSATYGVWLRASSRNVIANFSVSHNTQAESISDAFAAAACSAKPARPTHRYRRATDNIPTSVNDPSSADGRSQPEQAYGVAIAAGNVGNRVVGVEGSGNGNGSFGVDALDGNPNCAGNLWTGNQFAITSPSACILH